MAPAPVRGQQHRGERDQQQYAGKNHSWSATSQPASLISPGLTPASRAEPTARTATAANTAAGHSNRSARRLTHRAQFSPDA
jgi:hypothetical protein